MPRGKSSFICRECGYVSPGWLGRCPGCGQWNTITEEAARSGNALRVAGPPAAAPATTRLTDIDPAAQTRIDTGLEELNRVLGGGLVPGSVVLVGGEPGVGKSTLLLQALLSMEARGVSALLVSGEESAAQVKLRSVRLTGDRSGLRLLTETQTEVVVAALEHLKPAACVVDSVQTLWSTEVGSTPGSVAQITASYLERSRSCSCASESMSSQPEPPVSTAPISSNRTPRCLTLNRSGISSTRGFSVKNPPIMPGLAPVLSSIKSSISDKVKCSTEAGGAATGSAGTDCTGKRLLI